jgi:hypothetical protein
MSRAASFALVVLVCLAASKESFAQPPITIRVYDSVAQSPDERASAIRAAAAIFERAGLNTSWRDCGRGGADYPCAGTRQPHDLILRILPRAADLDVPASNAVTAATDSDSEAIRTERLGFAAVAARAGGGTVATVYAEHIGRVTARTGVAFDLLLGRAIAHEIGHLLSGASGHTTTGLMRAVWTDDELRRNRLEDWTYLADVARTTRSRGKTVEGSSGVSPGDAPFD